MIFNDFSRYPERYSHLNKKKQKTNSHYKNTLYSYRQPPAKNSSQSSNHRPTLCNEPRFCDFDFGKRSVPCTTAQCHPHMRTPQSPLKCTRNQRPLRIPSARQVHSISKVKAFTAAAALVSDMCAMCIRMDAVSALPSDCPSNACDHS